MYFFSSRLNQGLKLERFSCHLFMFQKLTLLTDSDYYIFFYIFTLNTNLFEVANIFNIIGFKLPRRVLTKIVTNKGSRIYALRNKGYTHTQ